MTPFLVATLLALLIAGGLFITWRERRVQFPQIAAAMAGLALLSGSYVWFVMHGHRVAGDSSMVQLSNIKVATVAGSYRVSGTARNGSRTLSISALAIRLRVDDCTTADNRACTTLHDDVEDIIVSVPPGETRDFMKVFNTPRLAFAGHAAFFVSAEGPRTYQAQPR